MHTQDEKILQWAQPYIVKNTNTEEDWDTLIEKKQLMLCDVGYNVGLFSNLFLDMFGTSYDISIFAFEPNPSATSSRAEIKLFNKAVSDKEEQLVLHVPVLKTDRSKTLSPIASLINRPAFHEWDDADIMEFNVSSIVLDNFIEQQLISTINYLKVDVEGYELNVFRGCANALAKGIVNAGHFEYGNTFLDAGYTVSDVVNFLDKNAYACFLGSVSPQNILTVENCQQVLSERSNDHWENVLFINKSLLTNFY